MGSIGCQLYVEVFRVSAPETDGRKLQLMPNVFGWPEKEVEKDQRTDRRIEKSFRLPSWINRVRILEIHSRVRLVGQGPVGNLLRKQPCLWKLRSVSPVQMEAYSRGALPVPDQLFRYG